MGVRSIIVTLLASSLFACGGASQTDAKGPESNPWADYKGTYATSAAPHAPNAKAAKTEVAKSEVPAEAPVEEKVEEAPAPVAPAAPAKKAKSAKGAAAKKKK
jgi:hypothetical protein